MLQSQHPNHPTKLKARSMRPHCLSIQSTRLRHLWMQTPPSATHYNPTASTSAPPPTAVSVYLASPLVSETEVNRLAGFLQFWENETKASSILGRLALDILTARSSSAKMAVSSWFDTPLLSDVAEVLDMVEGQGDTEKSLDTD
ncbi:unnamed protein product [Rhizoctonia solani]|uniref:Uncharacterized protein n=1 Tax=Rhizoctonia solani TaxID=456999 RepID=A0A8H3GPU2_9AGAM|nr:unnamed protein product [Rhizoctonia solani]